MKSCYKCINNKSITFLPKDFGCILVCNNYNSSDKGWIIHYPTVRASFCKQYTTKEMLNNCFSYCENHGTKDCPTSIKCLALENRPYFKLKKK